MIKKSISIADMTTMIASPDAPHLAICHLTGGLVELNDQLAPIAELTIHKVGMDMFDSLYENDAFCIAPVSGSTYQHCRNWSTTDSIPEAKIKYIRETGFIDQH